MRSPQIHIPFEKIELYLPVILKERLNLEIYFNSYILDSIQADTVRRLRESLSHDPFLTVHAPFMDLSPGAVDVKVRSVTIERFNEILDLSTLLKPACIVFHSGYEKWKYAFNVNLWLEKSLETWEPLNKRAKDLGISLAIENIFEDEPGNLKLLMESMSSENFGICFDTGHCNLFSRVELTEWIKELKPFIIELHLHDNDRSADSHYPIGDGNFDFTTLFSSLKDNHCIHTIEAHTYERVLKSIERLKGYVG
ncbi:MAG: sugar phosphate isomerase/epimerase family protein [Dissulfurispiraceae bacterium]